MKARIRNLGLCVLAALALTSVAGAEVGPEMLGELELSFHNETELSGFFGRAGSLVHFSSRIDDAKVEIDLQVNTQRLHATFDPVNETVVWTGYDGALFIEEREALIALSRQLMETLQPEDRELSLPEHMLYRLVMYWAEAPVGLTLNKRRITRSAEDRRRDLAFEKSCYLSDDNGIAYISCSTATRVFCHDADGGGHCWGCWYSWSGCGANCLSECGPGCYGLNIWTWDCGDHDQCCGDHGGCINPFDTECGDEYGEAADDFLLGWPNCGC